MCHKPCNINKIQNKTKQNTYYNMIIVKQSLATWIKSCKLVITLVQWRGLIERRLFSYMCALTTKPFLKHVSVVVWTCEPLLPPSTSRGNRIPYLLCLRWTTTVSDKNIRELTQSVRKLPCVTLMISKTSSVPLQRMRIGGPKYWTCLSLRYHTCRFKITCKWYYFLHVVHG